jgi:RHS repeat-associated protein
MGEGEIYLRYDAHELPIYRATIKTRQAGQRYESAIGLYYYGARWSPGRAPGTGDPMMGRFIQTDTIVPGGIQGLDRYAYTANNPLRYIDPSGHDYCESSNADPEDCRQVDPNGDGKSDYDTIYILENYYGVTLSDGFSTREISAIYAAVQAVGAKFSQEIGGGYTSGEVFMQVFEYLIISSGCSIAECGTVGGITDGAHYIRFSRLDAGFMRARNNVVHELGHAFNNLFATGYQPADALGQTQSRNPDFPNRLDFPLNYDEYWTGPNSGFASGQNVYTWQMSYALAGSTSEEFADQFLGWTFNTWEPAVGSSNYGPYRSLWMNNSMPGWI